MKKVNFMISLTPEKQYAIKRWFWLTFFLCLGSVSIIIYLIVPQLLIYHALRKEVTVLREKTKDYASSVKQTNALKAEQELVRVRTKKIDNYHEAIKNPLPYIVAITQACSESVVLESVRFNKKECEIAIVCPTAEHANVFMKRLSALDLFERIKLVSLQYEAHIKKFRCVVKSIMKKV